MWKKKTKENVKLYVAIHFFLVFDSLSSQAIKLSLVKTHYSKIFCQKYFHYYSIIKHHGTCTYINLCHGIVEYYLLVLIFFVIDEWLAIKCCSAIHRWTLESLFSRWFDRWEPSLARPNDVSCFSIIRNWQYKSLTEQKIRKMSFYLQYLFTLSIWT